LRPLPYILSLIDELAPDDVGWTRLGRMARAVGMHPTPEYDQSILVAPPTDDAEPEGEDAAPSGRGR